MASVIIENTPWYKIRFEEMLKGLELRASIGEKKKTAFQARRAGVKQRQEFLQHRRIARLRMEGIIIDLEAVKRRCNAPRELMWYEQISDEEEKKKLMRKRLKEMFKPKKRFNGIQERTESSCSDESTGKMTKGAEESVPQRGNVLRNYTKLYGVVQEKTKALSDEREEDATTTKEDEAIEKPADIQLTSTTLPKLTSATLVDTKKPVTPKTRNRPIVEKKVAGQKFQKAVTKVTTVSLIGDGLGRKSMSPVVQKMGAFKRPSRHSSDSGSSSPALPRISSGVSHK